MRLMLGLILILSMICVVSAQSGMSAAAYSCKQQCCTNNGGTYDSSTTVCSDASTAGGVCIDNCYSQAVHDAAVQSGKSESEANSLSQKDTQCMRDCCGTAGGTLDAEGFCNGDYPDANLGSCYKGCFDSTLNEASASSSGCCGPAFLLPLILAGAFLRR
jgi:hypothetical protein